jgi:hypothetical protein
VALTEDQREKALRYLHEKAGPAPFPCDWCGQDRWTVDYELWALLKIEKATLITREHVPAFSLSCDNCRQIKLFAGEPAGLTAKVV